MAQQQPLAAFQLRSNFRHHGSHVYTVTEGPVRERKYAVASRIAEPARQLDEVEALRAQLASEPELVIIFGDTVKGEAVRRLAAFGDSLGIRVKYVCLVDYSNSRGAADIALALSNRGLSVSEMVEASGLDVLWVVGSNPLKRGPLGSEGAFVVVQDMFMTETAHGALLRRPIA